MRLILKTLALVVITAAFAATTVSAAIPKLPIYRQFSVKPGKQFRMIIRGRNVVVSHDIDCQNNGLDRIPASKDIGGEAKMVRLSARAWTRPCTITVQILPGSHRRPSAVCASFMTRTASDKPFPVLTCAIPRVS